MEFQLRPYQVEIVRRGVEFLLDPRAKRGGLIICPTGAGKSWIIAGIANELNSSVLVFQPSREILLQNKQKMEHYGFTPSVFSASLGRREVGDIVLATIGSVAARGGGISKADLFTDFPYILIDECHLVGQDGMYKSFFDEVDARLLGLSATPFRLASSSLGTQLKFLTRTRPRIFSEVVAWAQNKDLFDAGFLSPMEYYEIGGFDDSLVQKNSSGADYDEKSLQMHLFKIGFQDKVVEVANRVIKAGRRNALVFVRFVKDAEYVASQIPGSAVVTAETGTAEREATGQAFKAGDIKIVVNCGVYLLGFDHPRLECVIDAAQSLSLTRVYQKWGRGARPHPGKKNCWIVDMCGGFKRFGRLQDMALYCENESKWALWGKPGGSSDEKQLTNVYLAGEGTKGLCPKCLTRRWFAIYRTTGRPLPLSSPPAGSKGNVIVEKENGKTYCRLGERGEGTAVFHYAYCSIFQKMKAQAA